MKFNALTIDSTIESAFAFFMLTKTSKGLTNYTLANINSFYNHLDRCLGAGGGSVKTTTLSIFKGGSAMDTLFRDYLEKRGLKAQSVHTYMMWYNAFYKYLADELEILPHRTLRLKPAPRVIKTLYTDEQLRRLLTPPKNIRKFYDYEIYVIVHFILNTGCRIHNVVELQMKDISRLEEGIVRFTKTKNGKPQLIFVPTATVAVLRKFINVWRSDATDEDYVFCNSRGGKATTNALNQQYIQYVERHGGAGCPTSFHLLRHQYASTFLKNGGSIYDLKRQLGHSSFDMVQWYADHYAEPNVENMERFTPSFNLEKGKKLEPKIKK